MNRRGLCILKSVLAFFFLVGALFGALALLPAWAQGPESGWAAPDEPFGPDAGIQALPSTTGYVIDDGDVPGFSPPPPYPTGNWLAFGAGGYQGDCIYTAADDSADVAEWRPDLDEGRYQVQVHYWANSTAGTQRDDALYTIYYDGGTASHRVNQQQKADGTAAPGGADSGWLTLGRYRFVRGTVGYVELDDSTTVGGTGNNVVADAVRFLPTRVWVDDGYTSAGTNDGHLWGVTAFNSIRDGIAAVADYGTVTVRPGTYNQYITVTKPISLSGASPATTIITVLPAVNTAVELLSSDVNISGFTIQSSGATYGIRNFDIATGPPWVFLTGYRIENNVIHGFNYGMRLRGSSGVISDSTVYNNARVGVWLEDPTGASTAPTTVSGSTFYSNGGTAGYDYDILVAESYAGSVVSGNTITGSGAAGEAGIYVRDDAAGLTLSANSITGCEQGVRIWQESLVALSAQTVDVHGNTITGGTRGIHVGRDIGAPWTWAGRQLIIGGSVANANQVYGDSGYELELYRYRADITATYNYWGVCTYRAIEDEIWHDYDNPAPLGTVIYDPALCVPYTITVEADPTSLPADGMSTSAITATVRDVAGTRAQPGTMIGITTSLGSVPYGYAEAEGGAVTRTAGWTILSTPPYQRASGGAVARASVSSESISWGFTGQAVSLLYMKRTTAGSADVYVDGGLVTTINMASPVVNEFRVEDVIATWPSVGAHTIEVRPVGGAPVFIDAFRSGGVVATQGRITTTLTTTTTPGIANIWATVYDGHIITPTSALLYPIITDTTTVTFQAADLYISKSAFPTSLNSGQEVTYTITYGNSGPEIATNTTITDTLPVNFLRVRSSSSPDNEPPTLVAPRKWVWDVGDLAPGATGVITLVARPDQSSSWCVPVNRPNVAEIVSSVPDPAAGNNSSGQVWVSVVVPTLVGISAHPPAIGVSNGTVTTTLRITVTDSNSNLVHGVPVSLTTTAGSFPVSSDTTLVATTTNGVAFAALASSMTVTTATVTAQVMPACAGMPTDTVQVQFLPGFPDVITSTWYPTLIRLCGDEAVVTATVRDAFGNLVEDGTEVNFNVVEGERGDMYPRLTATVNGVATSTLRTKGYLFGPRVLHVYILARRETQEATDLITVDLEEGLPDTISLSSSPDVLQVGGFYAEIRAVVRDCGGNNVQDGTVVTFTVNGLGTFTTPSVVSTTNGVARTTFKSDCTMGTAVISATADSIVAITSLMLEPGPADLISVAAPVPPSIRNCGGQAVIEAMVYDICGNLVKDGTPVQFASQYNYVRASPEMAYTRGGVVSTTVTSLDKLLTTWPVTLEQIDVVSPPAFPGFTNLNILPGLSEDVQITADPGQIPINGDVNFYDIIVVARVEDCSDTVVEDGTLVTLETDLGIFRESGMRTLPRWTVGGLVTGTLTSQSIAGTVTLTATADSVVTTTNVLFLPGEPWLVEVWGIPQTIYADGRSISQVSALVMDEFRNHVLDGVEIEFVTDYGHFYESMGTAYTTSTDINGYAFTRLVSDTVPRTALVRAIVVSNSRQGYSYVFFAELPEVRYIYLPIIMRRATR